MHVLFATWRRAFDRILWADAVHAAAISAAPVLMAALLGEPRMGWMAIAAFWACYGDPGGPMRQRVEAMLMLGVVGAAFCFLASAAASSLWFLLPLTFLCCTAGGMFRVWGSAASIMGTLLSGVFVVSCELPAHGLIDSLAYAGIFMAGTLWAILMTAVVWRRRPWKDATYSVAQCYRGLADFADSLGERYSGIERHDGTPSWTSVNRAHRAALRAAVEAARVRIEEVSDSRPSRGARADQLRFLLQSAEDSFIALVAMAELTESHLREWRAHELGRFHSQALHRYASLCNAIASTTNILDVRQAERLRNHYAQFEVGLNDNATNACTSSYLVAIAQALETMRRAASGVIDSLFGGAPSGAASQQISQNRRPSLPWTTTFRTLRQNLSWESDALRHATRVGVGATIAVALSKTFTVNHGYWIALTLIFVLQPYFATTWTRTLERVAGSVAGALGASLLGLFLGSPLSVALAVLPIALGTFVSRGIHYALFTFFLTSQFVLVSHIQQPSIDEPVLAALRAMNSVFGGLLALLVGVFFWPTREPRELAGGLTHALARHARYVRELLNSLSGAERTEGEGTDNDLPTLRREACLAADNAEASLQRIQKNPMRRDRGLDTARALLNAMRRLTAAGTVLEMHVSPTHTENSTMGAALRHYGIVLAGALLPEDAHTDHESATAAPTEHAALSLPRELEQAPPALAEPLGRLTEQVQHIAQLLARLAKR
jgi:uncharacterized membrane protein YccC